MLTMLNPKAANMQIGSGGIPRYTPADIAICLGMIDHELGAAILCYIHAPDMAAVQSPSLEDRLRILMQTERDRRVREEQKARMDLHIARENYSAMSRRDITHASQLNRLKSIHREAKSRLWPEREDAQDAYALIRRVILCDLRRRHVCESCSGMRNVIINGEVAECAKCKGSGYSRRSYYQVAKIIGRSRSTFSKCWRGVYDFTYRAVNAAQLEAERQFRKVTS